MYAVIGENIKRINSYSYVGNFVYYDDEQHNVLKVNKNYFDILTDDEYQKIIRSDNPIVEKKYQIIKKKAIEQAKENGFTLNMYDMKKLETLAYEAAANNLNELNSYEVVGSVGNQ